MARQSLRRKEHHVDADFIRRARKAGDEHFRRRRDASQAPLVDRKVEVFGALAPFHLDEGERFAAPRDEVDLARWNAEALPEDAPAVQPQPPCGAPFGPAAPRFGGGAVQARSFNASARA